MTESQDNATMEVTAEPETRQETLKRLGEEFVSRCPKDVKEMEILNAIRDAMLDREREKAKTKEPTLGQVRRAEEEARQARAEAEIAKQQLAQLKGERYQEAETEKNQADDEKSQTVDETIKAKDNASSKK